MDIPNAAARDRAAEPSRPTPERDPPVEVRDVEQRAVAFHEHEGEEAATLWREGLNILLRGLDPFDGHTITGSEQAPVLAFLVVALQGLHCSYELAVRGYFPQALNLHRVPMENALAAAYLLVEPGNHARFTQKAPGPPKRTTMLTRIGRAFGQDVAEHMRLVLKQLDSFSHVDRLGISMVTQRGEKSLLVSVLPQQSEKWFTACAWSANSVTVSLFAALDQLRQNLGYSALEGRREYVLRSSEWKQKVGPS